MHIKGPFKTRSFFLKLFFVIVVSLIALSSGALFYVIHHKQIDFFVLDQFQMAKPSIVLDDEGNEWARFEIDKRRSIAFDAIPLHLIQAFMAAEDHNFFEHAGLSAKGIVRSIAMNLYYGRCVQGASTITQQLVRLLFFNTKKTFTRKLKEQFYALLIERQFSKEHIFQAYLNNICLGCGIYGVEAACQRFWAKSVSDITLEQAATLAGIVKNPQCYCPLLSPLAAEKRRNIILLSMKRLEFITQMEYDAALGTSVVTHKVEKNYKGSHFKEMVRQFLEQLVGKQELYTGGFIIQTTINKHMQQVAEDAFKLHLEKLKKKLVKELDGALLSLDAKTGEIKAVIGGFDFTCSQFNRALQAHRQIGSTIKPIVYAAALVQGFKFTDTLVDEPIEIMHAGTFWKPQNNTHCFEGTMTLARALAHSNNIIPIKILLKIGASTIALLAKAMHLGAEIPAYPSLALGCVDCSLFDVVGMFNIFTNHGTYVQPHCVLWVKNTLGKKIWKYVPKDEIILPARISDQVMRVLTVGIERARKTYTNNWLEVEAFGKTGTTNDSRTCWFVGATPTITTGIYIGCDNNTPLGNNVYGIATAFPIWLQLHTNITHPLKRFLYDSSLREVTIDGRTGKKITNKNSPDAITLLC